MSHGAEGSVRAILYALGANFGIAVAKFAAAAWTGSGSMLAEAIHSTADCVNQLLLLLGMREARRPESVDHPLGHHRAAYFWSMVVALLLFFMGGAFSVYEGVERMLHPQPLQNGLIAMAVLGVAVILEAFSLAGDPLWDALGTLAVGVVLMVIAVAIMIEVKSLIVGESADPEQRAAIETFIAAQPEVAQVFNVITLAWGERIVIAVKARMADDETISGAEMVRRINAVEERIQAEFRSARWVFFEPDVK